MDALRVVTTQELCDSNRLVYYFTSWPRLASFHELLRKSKVRLSPKYRPVATRVKDKIRVSWINDRRPTFYLKSVAVNSENDMQVDE